MRAIDCPCGHHLEGADDEELFRLARAHVDSDHPEMERTDDELRERVAADAYEAIAVLESRRDIRVVFTDIRMPGSMDGLKLAHAVRDRWPPVHIIATSGYHAITATDLPAGSLLLLKPYSERKIVDALHAFTGAPR